MFVTISLIIILIYALMLLWFTDALWKNNIIINSINEEKPFVSIIISARNEEKNILTLLQQLQKQNYPNNKYEIIIANDRSTDNTLKILNQSKENINNLNIINIKKTPIDWAPKKWALNQAIKQSKGSILIFTDADCKPLKNWINKIIKIFVQNENIGFVSAPSPLTNSKTLIDDMFEVDSLSQDAINAAGFYSGIPLSCSGRNIALRKEVFLEINGYDEINSFISGDDDLLMHKISNTDWELYFISDPECIVVSPPPKNLKQFINQRIRFASKSLNYYNLDTNKYFRIILPFIYIVNLIICLNIILFMESLSIIFLSIFIVKLISDWIIVFSFYTIIKKQFPWVAFLILALIHPFYIFIFGTLGPFKKFSWK